MKIDFITSRLSGGGAERVMAILANHFAEKGYIVSLISFNEGDAYPLKPEINRIRLHDGKFSNHRLRSFYSLYKHYKIKSNRPDVIIAFITLINLIAILVAKIYKIKIIVSEHNSHLQAQQPKFLTHFTRNFIYRMSDYVTVLTGFDINFYKKKKAKVVVMPNPCTFIPLAENSHPREKTILAIGDLNRYHHKGFDNLIGLIGPVLKKYPEWSLNLIGGGLKGKEFLVSLAEQEDIVNQVQFSGFQNNVNEHMKKASIYILSSRYEGLPMVLLEAMSQGMTCIAYDCKTGPADLITSNFNGLLVEDQNIAHMQAGLIELIENDELRKQLSLNAIRSLDEYSMESIAHKWEELFKTF